MGYMSLISPCLVCGKIFASNPHYVPSLRGEPVCLDCMIDANEKRVELGMEPHPIHPQAYEPAEEH